MAIPSWVYAAQASALQAATASRKTTGKVAPRVAANTPAPVTKTAPLDMETLAEHYGMTTGFINAYPEVRALFQQAARDGWEKEKFQAKFKNTNWWKSMSDSQRKAAIMQKTDPTTWSALWTKTNAHVRDMMAAAGANADDWSQVDAIASKVIWEGYNDDQARNMIGQWVVFGPSGLAGGKAGEVQSQLAEYAYQMGIKNADWWTQDAVRQVVSGRKDVQSYKNELMSMAIANFPGYEKQIKAGSTVQDLAQPYMQSMSQILEIPAGQVNLFDPTIRNALSWKDPQGQAGSKPLWQFQNEIRTDPRWSQTKNAQDAVMGTAHKVLSDMGFYY